MGSVFSIMQRGVKPTVKCGKIDDGKIVANSENVAIS